jgi:hypothetical protein
LPHEAPVTGVSASATLTANIGTSFGFMVLSLVGSNSELDFQPLASIASW